MYSGIYINTYVILLYLERERDIPIRFLNFRPCLYIQVCLYIYLYIYTKIPTSYQPNFYVSQGSPPYFRYTSFLHYVAVVVVVISLFTPPPGAESFPVCVLFRSKDITLRNTTLLYLHIPYTWFQSRASHSIVVVVASLALLIYHADSIFLSRWLVP